MHLHVILAQIEIITTTHWGRLMLAVLAQINLALLSIYLAVFFYVRYRQVAYGFPTLILIAAVIIDQLSLDGATYTSNDYCWMRANLLFLSSFLVPVSAIILINMGTLGIAIYRYIITLMAVSLHLTCIMQINGFRASNR